MKRRAFQRRSRSAHRELGRGFRLTDAVGTVVKDILA